MGAAATVTVVFMLSNAPTPLYPIWQRQWGFDAGTLTVIFSSYVLGLIGTLVVAGKLADRYGRKVVIVPGVIATLLGALCFLFAQGVVWLLAARFLTGIGVGTAVTAGLAAAVDLAPEARHRVASLISSAAQVTGAGLGPLLAGAVLQSGSPSPDAWIFGVLAVLAVGAGLLGLMLPLRRPSGPTTHGGLLRLPGVPVENRRDLLLGVITYGPGVTATAFVLSLGPNILARLLHVPNPFAVGATACAMFVAATGVQFAAGRLSIAKQLLLSSCSALAAMLVTATCVAFAPILWLFVLGTLLAGATQGLGQLGGLTLLATRVPRSRRAEANSALNIGAYVPAALLTVGAGYLADVTSLLTAVETFCAVLFVAAAAAILVEGSGSSKSSPVPRSASN